MKLEYIAGPTCTRRSSTSSSCSGRLAILTAVPIASRQRWACTIMAAVYTAFGVAFLWILPLFPAEPKLGPVYRQVTHFIPWEFPLLIIVPAFVDRSDPPAHGGWRPLVARGSRGVAFLGVFVAVQWPFADFLMTPLARNWFFGTGVHGLRHARPIAVCAVRVLPRAEAAQFWRGMLIATLHLVPDGLDRDSRRPLDAEGQTVRRAAGRRAGSPPARRADRAASGRAAAHIGSPDVFLDAQAGPYRVFVTVRPPRAIPGVADVEVLTHRDDVHDVRIVPLPLTGPGAQFAPVPDRADAIRRRSAAVHRPSLDDDGRRLAGAGRGRGRRGEGTSVGAGADVAAGDARHERRRFAPAVRVDAPARAPASSASSRRMAREARLGAGRAAGSPRAPPRPDRRRHRDAWSSAASMCPRQRVVDRRSLELRAIRLQAARGVDAHVAPDRPPDAGELRDPGWIASRRLDDFVPDHGHLMHLFIVSPALDRLWHLHPARDRRPATFEQRLPDMPQGDTSCLRISCTRPASRKR